MNPRYPVYIVSKNRAASALTPRFLDEIGVPYHLIVEAEQRDEYAEHHPEDRLLVLERSYLDEYDTFDDLGDSKSKGPGAARNYAWEHSLAAGHSWHWVMDDNIKLLARMHENQRVPVGDGTILHAMEEFCARYSNVAMAGPQYWMFADSRDPLKPFVTGTRIYSCNLIRNSLPFRWRGRYNEDTDLSLRILKANWTTVLFNAFLQYKLPTQTLAGGNTDDFYIREGTLPKSRMLARMHPDVAHVTWRFGRWHHRVDYSRWLNKGLVRDPEYTPTVSEYRLARVKR
jgi:hypothetical protein